MKPTRQILVFSVVAALACAALWMARANQESARQASEREAGYAARLEHYQRELPTGSSLELVKQKLTEDGVSYSQQNTRRDAAPVYRVLLDSYKGNEFVCDHWDIYLDFEFDANQRLMRIHPGRQGHCL